jgi:hypothetical protein
LIVHSYKPGTLAALLLLLLVLTIAEGNRNANQQPIVPIVGFPA